MTRMTHYVDDQATGRALCGAIVLPDDHSLVPDCPDCRQRIVDACRAVAEAWVLPEDKAGRAT
jgi:hypothetical protein